MRTRTIPLLVVAVSATFLLAACSGATSDSAQPSSETAVGSIAVAPDAIGSVPQEGLTQDGKVDGSPTTQQPSVIRTAYVSLEVVDVGRANFDVHGLVDKRHGLVSSEDTRVDGDSSYSSLTVQIPAADLDAFIAEVSALGTVESVNVSAQDVTTQVVDLDARIRALQTSIDRMEVLLARAEKIDDLLAIETQLSQRQAELDSLKAQRAYLGDQVALSAVTINLAPTTAVPDIDAQGFLSGLHSGLSTFASAIAVGVTALGFLLPFAVVLLIVLVPLTAIAVRQSRRRTRPATIERETADTSK